MCEDGDKPRYLAIEALLPLLRKMSDADLLRLYKKARLYAVGTGMSERELVHEAIVRAAAGDRRCPADVSVVVFLGNAIRSIADAEREKRNREVNDASADDDCDDTPAVAAAGAAAGDLTARHAESFQIVERLEAEFQDDEQAQAVIMGAAEGWTPAEIKQVGNMDDTQYATARRRVRRTFERKFAPSTDDE